MAEGADGPDALVRQSKRLAILAYLALATADGFRRRDQVIALFWPELDQANGRTYLRKALHGIRESLGEDTFVSRGEDEIRVDSARISCDAVLLLDHVQQGRWSDALTLYGGELLEGLFPEGVGQEFHDWLGAQRKKLREAAASAAWKCSELEESRGDRTAAAVMARRARELDPDNEEGVRRLMALLDRRGDRSSALRLYAEWQSRLLEEFSVEPAPETRKLARHIQASRKGESHETPPVPPQPVVAHAESRGRNESTAAAPARPWRLNVVGSFGVAVLVLVAIIVALTCARTSGSSDAIDPHSVAVAPLNAIGGPAAREIADAISEEIATRLALDSGLVVLPIEQADIQRSGRSTAFATDGAVQRGDGSFRITLRLLRTSDGVAIWAGSYDEPEGVALGIVQRVSAAAVADMRSRIKGR